jgi:phytoene dehydrogenase-like protein
VSVSGAKWLRRYHAADFNLEHHPPGPAALGVDELARIPGGTQPVTDTHILCRLCGVWLKGLAAISPSNTASMPLATVDDSASPPTWGWLLPDPSAANVRGRRERIEERAREHGYADVADLIVNTRAVPAATVATMLGTSAGHVYNLRRRHR